MIRWRKYQLDACCLAVPLRRGHSPLESKNTTLAYFFCLIIDSARGSANQAIAAIVLAGIEQYNNKIQSSIDWTLPAFIVRELAVTERGRSTASYTWSTSIAILKEKEACCLEKRRAHLHWKYRHCNHVV